MLNKQTQKALRFFSFCLIPLLVSGLFAVPAFALDRPDTPNAESVLVYNIENEEILYRKYTADGDKLDESGNAPAIYPASTAKIMTAILALEYYDNWDKTITVTRNAIKDVTGNNIGLKKDEIVTVRDLLHALIVAGANDAANVLAFDIAGNQADFVRKMNEKAAEIGAVNTVYTNPYGIHNANMRTTLDDTLAVALYAYRIGDFTSISSLAKYEMPKTNLTDIRNLHNRNYLIARNRETKYYYEGVIGMNAGSTSEAGYCLVTAIKNKGLSFLCIVMGAGESEKGDIYSYRYAKTLLEWAADAYAYLPLIDKSKMICELPVSLSNDADHVTLRPEHGIEKYLPIDTDIDREIDVTYTLFTDSLEAPVDMGQAAGELVLSYRGEEVGRIPLVTTVSVDRTEFLYVLQQIKGVVTSRPFIAAAVVFLILTIGYLLLLSRMQARRSRRTPPRYIGPQNRPRR